MLIRYLTYWPSKIFMDMILKFELLRLLKNLVLGKPKRKLKYTIYVKLFPLLNIPRFNLRIYAIWSSISYQIINKCTFYSYLLERYLPHVESKTSLPKSPKKPTGRKLNWTTRIVSNRKRNFNYLFRNDGSKCRSWTFITDFVC